MREFSKDSFNRSYSATPILFETATSSHFVCKYAYRDDDTLYQFSPKVLPIRSDFVSKIQKLLPEIIGAERASKCSVEHLTDDQLEGGESVCLIVPGFTNKTTESSKRLSTKLLTDFHESLS